MFPTPMPSIHPGEILKAEFLKPFGITEYRLAKDIHVPPRRINEITHGIRAISADTALRLSRYFSTTAQFWMNLQSDYDLELHKLKLADRLQTEVIVLQVNNAGAIKPSIQKQIVAAKKQIAAGKALSLEKVKQRYAV